MFVLVLLVTLVCFIWRHLVPYAQHAMLTEDGHTIYLFSQQPLAVKSRILQTQARCTHTSRIIPTQFPLLHLVYSGFGVCVVLVLTVATSAS